MHADIAIHLATPADAGQIAALSREHIEYGLPWRWTAARVLRCMRDPATNVAIVREQDRVTGFGIMGYADEDAHLLLLAVDPDRRRLGIASAILAWLEDVARVAGAARVQLEARQRNDAARCFYNEHGYHERVLREGMYGGTDPGVILEKWLRDEAAPAD
jgi:ribosomal-protein-alanine N-acetyltransferase